MIESIKSRAADILPVLRAKLRPNYLKKGDAWIGRAVNSRTVRVSEIADSLVTRGGLAEASSVVRNIVEDFVSEVLFLVASGMVCNLGPFSVYPKIKGTFKGPGRPWDSKKNPVELRTRITAEGRRIAKLIKIELDGVYANDAYIDSAICLGAVNDSIRGGKNITLLGYKFKIDGPAVENGLFLVPLLNPQAAVRIDELALNDPSRIIALVPADLTYAEYTVRIVTQYSGGTTLREPRVIESDFTLTSI